MCPFSEIGPFYRAQADPPALEAILRVALGEERVDRSYHVMYSLCRDVLKRLDDPDRKERILLEAIEAHRVLPITVDLLRTLGFEHGWVRNEALPEQFRTLPSKQFGEVVDVAVDDVRKQAEEGVLLGRYLLDEYLYFWMSAAGKDEPTAYLRSFLDGTSDFTALIRSLIGEENARLVQAGESVPDEPTVSSHLRALWIFEVADEARSQADALLADKDRALLQWFTSVHDANSRRVDDG